MNVHYLDKAAFMHGNAGEGEEAMVFETSPSYDDIVVKVRNVLNWINPSDGVKLVGRYDVGVGVKSRLKSMPITSQLHWDVYKEKVEGSQDKSLELFATKVEVPRPLLDLNRNVSSPIHDVVVVYDHNAASQPPSSQPNEEDINARAIVLVGDDHVEDEAVLMLMNMQMFLLMKMPLLMLMEMLLLKMMCMRKKNRFITIPLVTWMSLCINKTWTGTYLIAVCVGMSRMMRVHRKNWMRMDSRRKKIKFTRRSLVRKEDPLCFVILALPTRPLLMVA